MTSTPENGRRMKEPRISLNEVFDKKEWSDIESELPRSHLYTSWMWGEYKRGQGWGILRLSVVDNEKKCVIGCFQLQRKKVARLLSLFLVQGGIQLKDASGVDYDKTVECLLTEFVEKHSPAIAMVYHRAEWSDELQVSFLKNLFTPVQGTAQFTYFIERSTGALDGERLTKNWRHNLKRAKKNESMSVEWVENPSERLEALHHLEQMYAALRERKSFGSAVDFERARDMIAESPEFKIAIARRGDEVLAIRVGYACVDHIFDFLAASTESARKTYANYLLVWEMISLARDSGKSYFDCGGINPGASMGVFNFKKGIGGRVGINGPIWVRGSTALMTRLGRLLLSLKG